MRKQYHFRRVGNDVHVWDLDRLVDAARSMETVHVPLADIRGLDEPYRFDVAGGEPTCRSVLEHARLVQEADLSFPVVFSSDGRVMDGMHRVGKAWLLGKSEVSAVRFDVDPPPDYKNPGPKDLPY